MARTATGLSKKTNRDNMEALRLCWTWRDQFGIGVNVDPEFAWVITDGRYGSQPANWGQAGNFEYGKSEATLDTFKIAQYVIKMSA